MYADPLRFDQQVIASQLRGIEVLESDVALRQEVVAGQADLTPKLTKPS